MIDSVLGPFRIIDKLGEGGMGEVYRARDTRLGREVALKILPDVFADDPDRPARFGREAQVLASLSHPNIGGIHGLEEIGETRVLILELVNGPTLADRIAHGRLLGHQWVHRLRTERRCLACLRERRESRADRGSRRR